MIHIYIDCASISAAPSLVLLSSVGSGGWNGPPENMVRCMENNYPTLGFWRP
ncbi:hypothetical protein BGW80DRAFT_1347178 [Lactifluus volemus]|nr:hypothetical protein BGW80DRAFT_1347178 [Lactifluus volemus]